jgi:hypothetical protein
MSRIWMCLSLWLATLLAVAFLIPIVAPDGSPNGASVVAGFLVALQVSGLGIAIYAAVLAWRHRTTPRHIALCAVPPIIVIAGFFALFPLMVLANVVER